MKLFVPALLTGMSRRRFLSAAAAATACSGADAEPSPEPLVVEMGPAQRPQTDVEAWNVGLISAYQPGLTSAENHVRDQQLWADICRSPFGRLLVRGCYVENCSGEARAVDVRAYLLVGDTDDSGNLKGFLRKLGRAYEQDAFVYKNYYRDAELHALKDLPDPGMANRETRSLGAFSPDLVGHYFTLMTRRDAMPLSLDKFHTGLDGEDWLGGRWEDIGLWTTKSFSARAERRVYFEGGSHRVCAGRELSPCLPTQGKDCAPTRPPKYRP